MKTKSALLTAILALLILTAQAQSDDVDRQRVAVTLAPSTPGVGAEGASGVHDSAPQSPEQLKQMYEAEMVAVTERFSDGLAAITDAVEHGDLTAEQGQKHSAELYQLSIMQLELFQAWREMLESPQREEPQRSSDATPATDVVTVDLPFSSLQLDPAVAEYLRLTPAQTQTVHQLMEQEKQGLGRVIAEMRDTSQKLFAAGGRHLTESDVNALAKKQAALLAKLIVANARLQEQIYALLNPQQQRKLDILKDSTVVAGK